MEENLEDIAEGGKLNDFLLGFRTTEGVLHDMSIKHRITWDLFRLHVY